MLKLESKPHLAKIPIFRVSGSADNIKSCVKDGTSTKSVHCGELYISKSAFTTELWGMTLLAKHSEKAMHSKPTRAKMAGYWMTVKPNPASFARQRYGDDIFKHAEHWRALGMDGKNIFHAGTFRNCTNPVFHLCLNGNYLPFGNLILKGAYT